MTTRKYAALMSAVVGVVVMHFGGAVAAGIPGILAVAGGLWIMYGIMFFYGGDST